MDIHRYPYRGSTVTIVTRKTSIAGNKAMVIKENLKNLSYKKKQDETANITKKKTKRKRKEEKRRRKTDYYLESVGQFVATMPREHTAKTTMIFYYKPLTTRTSASVPCIKLIEPY